MTDLSVINYTGKMIEMGSFGADGLILAQGKDSNLLMLNQLEKPFKRADGKIAHFELTYRWLSTNCQRADDEAFACVSGSDTIYLRKAEVPKEIQEGAGNLFDHFHLF